MRAHHHGRMLVAVATAAGIAAAPASAKFDNTTYTPENAGQNVVHQSGGDSTEWPLIGVGIAGIAGITLVGGGMARTRRVTRRAADRRTPSHS
jgi:hypothetical protein